MFTRLCKKCGKNISVMARDIFSNLCHKCRREQYEKERKEKEIERKERATELEKELKDNEKEQKRDAQKRVAQGIDEPITSPVSGGILIAIAVLIAIISGFLIATSNPVGFVGGCIAGMLYLAGVIRWALSGSQLIQLNRLHRQNIEIIDLLEIIANGGRTSDDIENLRALRESGQLTDSEYRVQRRKLFNRTDDDSR